MACLQIMVSNFIPKNASWYKQDLGDDNQSNAFVHEPNCCSDSSRQKLKEETTVEQTGLGSLFEDSTDQGLPKTPTP